MSNHLPGLELWEGILEQCAIRLLFCLLLFRRRFSVDLSHQIIENLTGESLVNNFSFKKTTTTQKFHYKVILSTEHYMYLYYIKIQNVIPEIV